MAVVVRRVEIKLIFARDFKYHAKAFLGEKVESYPLVVKGLEVIVWRTQVCTNELSSLRSVCYRVSNDIYPRLSVQIVKSNAGAVIEQKHNAR